MNNLTPKQKVEEVMRELPHDSPVREIFYNILFTEEEPPVDDVLQKVKLLARGLGLDMHLDKPGEPVKKTRGPPHPNGWENCTHVRYWRGDVGGPFEPYNGVWKCDICGNAYGDHR